MTFSWKNLEDAYVLHAQREALRVIRENPGHTFYAVALQESYRELDGQGWQVDRQQELGGQSTEVREPAMAAGIVRTSGPNFFDHAAHHGPERRVSVVDD